MSISSNIPTVTKAQVNTEVDTALDTAVPGSPTPDSINERIKTMDGLIYTMDSRITGTVSTLTTGNITTYSDAGCDVALNTAIPGGPNPDSINERIATMDGLIYTMDSRITGTVSTLTAQNVEDEAEDGALTALNTEIDASNNADSVNDILHDQLKPRLPTDGTISTLTTAQVNEQVDIALNTDIPGSPPQAGSINERIKTLDDNLTAANIEGYVDLALDNAVTISKTANSIGYRVASLHDRQKMKWQWAASYILLGSAGSSGDHAVVDLDDKEGFISCVDIFCDNATAGGQVDAAFTLNVELNDTASTAVPLLASGLFNTYWKANRMWGATTGANAGGVADTVRFPINLPFTSTTDALKVYINLTAGSGGGAVFLMVNYGEVI